MERTNKKVIDDCRNALVDDFALLNQFIINEQFAEAAVFTARMSESMLLFANILAAEALTELFKNPPSE